MNDDFADLVALRRDIHAHPEMAFAEVRTAKAVAAGLEACGIEVHRGIGGTGVVGVLRAGSSTRAIGLRADMDALPISESNQFPHASLHAGCMHACGHDGHVAMLLAGARTLATTRRFDGTVYFIFQPGEESGHGAQAMIEDGLFERFPMEAVYAAHNWPGLPVGAFAVSSGPAMAACNEITIEIRGKGGHAALPDQVSDPVLAASAIVQALQSIVSRNLPPAESAAVSITTLAAGDSLHVTPETATIAGTVRTYSPAVTDAIEKHIVRIATGVAEGYGCTASIDFERNCAATINHSGPAEIVATALTSYFGSENVKPMSPAMTAEDFAYMLERNPGCYFWIGNGEGHERAEGHGLGPCTLHNPSYDFDDRLIPIGAAAWTAIVQRALPPLGL
jgi:hippurate hydrolase